MRTRLLRPGFFTNEDLVLLPPLTRLFYAGLWCVADREGRLLDRPAKLKLLILPADAVTGEEMVTQLVANGFLTRYTVRGQRYLWIPRFRSQQNIHPHEAVSLLPPCELDDSTASSTLHAATTSTIGSTCNTIGSTCVTNGEQCTPLPSLPSCPSLPSGKEKIKEEELPKKEVCPETAEDRRSGPPPLLVFPTDGKIKEWSLVAEKVAEYEHAFPNLDILAECRHALQWCLDNPTKRKTARGMPAFLTRWLGRAQNSGRSGTPATKKSKETARQEVIDQWLQARTNTPAGSSDTPKPSDSTSQERLF